MESFFSVFDKYGWAGILAFIIAALVFLGVKWMSKKLSSDVSNGFKEVSNHLTKAMSDQNKDLIDVIVSQQGQMLDSILNKEKEKITNHNNMLNSRMVLAEEINMKLKDIMHLHNSHRAFILEFHNSYQNLSGVPFAKYSCNYEWFYKGLSPMCSTCIGMPFSSIAKIVQDVLNSETQQVIYNDMEKVEEDNPSLYGMLANTKVKGLVYTGLYDNKNILIGLLVLEYHHEINEDNINLQQLSVEAAELTSMLNIRYKYIDD